MVGRGRAEGSGGLPWATLASLVAGRRRSQGSPRGGSRRFARLARHAGATIGRGGGNFTHPRRPRRGLAEDGKICLPLVCRGGRIARVQLALVAFLSENEAMKQEDPAKSRFFTACLSSIYLSFASSAILCS